MATFLLSLLLIPLAHAQNLTITATFWGPISTYPTAAAIPGSILNSSGSLTTIALTYSDTLLHQILTPTLTFGGNTFIGSSSSLSNPTLSASVDISAGCSRPTADPSASITCQVGGFINLPGIACTDLPAALDDADKFLTPTGKDPKDVFTAPDKTCSTMFLHLNTQPAAFFTDLKVVLTATATATATTTATTTAIGTGATSTVTGSTNGTVVLSSGALHPTPSLNTTTAATGKKGAAPLVTPGVGLAALGAAAAWLL